MLHDHLKDLEKSIIDSRNSEMEVLKQIRKQKEEWVSSRLEDQEKHNIEISTLKWHAKECVQKNYESGYYHSHLHLIM